MTQPPLVSIILINYNSGLDAQECLEALYENTELPFEIIVVDNASSDNSIADIQQHFPDKDNLNIILNDDNVGYAVGINIALDHANGEFAVVMNMDVIVTQGWVTPMVDFMRANPKTGCVTPCIQLYDSPEKLNALGQNVNVTGLGFNRKLSRPMEENDPEPTRVSGLHGSIFLMRTEEFKALHGMNKYYFLYHEDVELSLRINIAGYDIYTVPDAVVKHKYDLHMTTHKLNWLERHRWVSLLSTYRVTTFILLSPFLLLTEMMMFGYCLTRGRSYLGVKFGAIKWVFNNWSDVKASRKQMQSVRQISDMKILKILRWGYNWDQFVVLARQNGGWLYEAVSRVFSRRTHDRAA